MPAGLELLERVAAGLEVVELVFVEPGTESVIVSPVVALEDVLGSGELEADVVVELVIIVEWAFGVVIALELAELVIGVFAWLARLVIVGFVGLVLAGPELVVIVERLPEVERELGFEVAGPEVGVRAESAG